MRKSCMIFFTITHIDKWDARIHIYTHFCCGTVHIASTGRVSNFSAIGKTCPFLKGSISADCCYVLRVEFLGSHRDVSMWWSCPFSFLLLAHPSFLPAPSLSIALLVCTTYAFLDLQILALSLWHHIKHKNKTQLSLLNMVLLDECRNS